MQRLVVDFEKYKDIVDVNQSMLHLDWRHKNVYRSLKSFYSNLQPRRHAGIPIETFMRYKLGLAQSIKLDLPVATAGVPCRDYVGISETVNTFVHSQYEIPSLYYDRIYVAKIDAKMQTAILS